MAEVGRARHARRGHRVHGPDACRDLGRSEAGGSAAHDPHRSRALRGRHARPRPGRGAPPPSPGTQALGLGRGDEPRRRGGLVPRHTPGCHARPMGLVAAGLGRLQLRAVLAAALLCTIGTAQALVLPKNTSYALAWVGWTALGWCAGLAAFSAVAPPLWHEGQSFWFGLVVGLAAAIVMALVMAAVTGVGAVRLVAAPASTDRRGRQFVTSLVGHADLRRRRPSARNGRRHRRRPGFRPRSRPSNALVIRSARGQRSVVPWRSVIDAPGQAAVRDR